MGSILRLLAVMWLVFFAGCLIAHYPLSTALSAPTITVGVLGLLSLLAHTVSRWENRRMWAARAKRRATAPAGGDYYDDGEGDE